MKKINLIIIFCLILSACTDKKAQEKAVLDDVLKLHDKVMGADEQLEKNKTQLDTLIKQTGFAGKDSAKMLATQLALADSAMETWMHNFDPDHTGKSHEETMVYMNKQKTQITAIDSQLNVAVTTSTKYLKNIKTK